MGFVVSAPSRAVDLQVAYVTPAELTPRARSLAPAPPPVPLRPSFSASSRRSPTICSPPMCSASSSSRPSTHFDVAADGRAHRATCCSAISTAPAAPTWRSTRSTRVDRPAGAQRRRARRPTRRRSSCRPSRRCKLANDEQLCLTQAIYHEARGESESGPVGRRQRHHQPRDEQEIPVDASAAWCSRTPTRAATSASSPSPATAGRTWAPSGAPGTAPTKLAAVAFREFQHGERPGVVPNSALYYHTTAVQPELVGQLQPRRHDRLARLLRDAN